MNYKELDYSLHYENWHSEDTFAQDVTYNEDYIASHAAFPASPSSKVLEIGCGLGTLMTALHNRGFRHVTGIDIDKNQIAAAAKKNLHVIRTPAIEYLEKSQESFQTIYLLDVLEHMDKPEQLKLLQQIFSHLTHDGMLMLSVPNAMTPMGLYFQHIDWTHYCSFSPTSLAFVLKNAGFFHFTFRPSHKEEPRIRRLKKPWKKILEAEFNMKNPILTPSVIAVCFKNEAMLKSYLEQAPDLMDFQMSFRSRLCAFLDLFYRAFHKLKQSFKSMLHI